jgi:urea transporter
MDILNDNRETNNQVEGKDKDAQKNISGLLFAGCMFLGLGGGFLIGNIVAGILIGMGIGFFVMAGYWMSNK